MSLPTSTRSPAIDALSGWPPPVLDPAGPYAGSIATLTWALIGMSIAVFAVVLIALYVALFGDEEKRRRLGGRRVIWVLGIIFPVVVLTALLVWGLSLTSRISAPAARPTWSMSAARTRRGARRSPRALL